MMKSLESLKEDNGRGKKKSERISPSSLTTISLTRLETQLTLRYGLDPTWRTGLRRWVLFLFRLCLLSIYRTSLIASRTVSFNESTTLNLVVKRSHSRMPSAKMLPSHTMWYMSTRHWPSIILPTMFDEIKIRLIREHVLISCSCHMRWIQTVIHTGMHG